MTTASPELYTYREGDEERIIDLLQEHSEDGISAFALCSQLTIKFQPLNAILERLQRNGQARCVQRKNGATSWYPDDKPPAECITERITKCYTPELENVKQDVIQQPAAQDDEVPERVPCPVDGCRSRILRKQKPAYAHLYNHHGLRGDELHARLDDVLGADRQRSGKVHSEDERRSCPIVGCPSEFRGHHSRSSLISHLVLRHDIEREEARGIADGKLAPPVMDAADPAVDADIIPPSEVECEGCDQLHDGECEQGEECVCNCATKMEQLQEATEPKASEPNPIKSASDPHNKYGRLPDAWRLPKDDAPQIEVVAETRPRTCDERSELSRLCALALDIEALVRSRGYRIGTRLTCEPTATALFVEIQEAGA